MIQHITFTYPPKRKKMKKLTLIISLILLALLIGCTDDLTPVKIEKATSDSILEKAYQEMLTQKSEPNAIDVVKKNPKKIYVHYMPWFKSLEEDGYWGQHWTMTNRNPNNIDAQGKREIASHYYPLIGPYSSNDKDLQEYHLLLMKLSGIDGVIFDWYGSRDVYDYNSIKKSTESFIEKIEDVGIEFSIMYEDKVAENIQTLRIPKINLNAAVTDLQYIENTYFTSKNYLRIDNSEILFLFGPNYIKDPLDWEYISSKLNVTPKFINLWKASDRLGRLSSGEFSWIDKYHMNTLHNYYEYTLANNIKTIGGIYPGFNDYYYEGGWRSDPTSDWEIPHNNIQTLEETLTLTDEYPVDFIQLITWNDFGEGTMVEPTLEFGYSFLEKIQNYTGVTYTKNDLEIPYKLYVLRKKYKNDPKMQIILKRVYQLIFTLNLDHAKAIIEAIEQN